MDSLSTLFREYGLASIFMVVLLEQIGVPVPAVPLLVLAGAAAINDPLYALYALILAVIASSIGDLAWFGAGRRYGHRVLKTLCRVSLSPDSCVRQTESTFERRGAATLLIAKFVPGLSTVAPPVAGALGLKAGTFLALNGAGAALWAGAAIAAGLIFHGQVDWLFGRVADLGGYAVALVAALFSLYVGWKWWERHRFLKSLEAARITVDELYAMMGRGENLVILDVRSKTHRDLHGLRIPGAMPVDLDDFDHVASGISPDHEVVVYCACPNDASAVKVAGMLRQRGFKRVRPLAGGIDAWTAAGLGLEELRRPDGTNG
jgi:membrane protein DedA with SNARE-associated domain/rhodanese-related sulfurtransferase